METIKPWLGAELEPADGRVVLGDECYEEIEKTSDLLKENPLPLMAIHPTDFEMPACQAIMDDVRNCLERNWGFCIIDRLPLDTMTKEIATAIYWLLAQMVGRPVAQKWSDGRMLYSVTDLGKPSGNGVRPDVTNEDQSFHTDNSYNICPPDVVGLFCLQPAMTGGISRIVNMNAVLEKMESKHKDLLPRLYQSYSFDRQREHPEDDEKTIANPILSKEGHALRVRISRNLIYQGYALENNTIDDEGEAALAAFFGIIDDPIMYQEFKFQPGQIQFLNNKVIGHKRTGFTDWPEKKDKRHLLRVWLREKGRAFYNG